MNILLSSSPLLLLLCCGIIEAQKCNDCVPFLDCAEAHEAALYPADQEQVNAVFIQAQCGLEDRQIKVCCSSFQTVGIAGHPNQRLLPNKCGIGGTERIVGGSEADPFEFPWMVLIAYRDRPRGVKLACGGSIINKRYVLTAAHCVQGQEILYVRIGEHNLTKNPDCDYSGYVPRYSCESYQNIQVERAIVHEGYQRSREIKSDIALLRLKEDIDLTDKINIGAICLPKTASLRIADLDNEVASIAGWGKNERTVQSDVLLKANINIYTTDACASYYNRNTKYDTTENKLCAGGFRTDSCNGDSGGPLMVERMYVDQRVRYIQYGIVSFGPSKCGSDFPGVYTDVRAYMHWILDNIAP